MGTNFTQYAIVGFKVSINDLKEVLSEKITEKQPRYNTKTGKIDKYEEVVVKEETCVYKLFGYTFESTWEVHEIAEQICNDFVYEDDDLIGVSHFDGDDLYIGVSLGDTNDLGRVELLEGEMSLEEITRAFEVAKRGLPGYDIKLYFVGRVG